VSRFLDRRATDARASVRGEVAQPRRSEAAAIAVASKLAGEAKHVTPTTPSTTRCHDKRHIVARDPTNVIAL